MVKKYIAGETKAQRKARKNASKGITPSANAPQSEAQKPEIYDAPDPTKKYYVVCLKWGDKYSPEYVNKLYRMVQRNLTINHEFICFTEQPANLVPGIRVIDLELIPGIEGWWYKPMFFDKNFPLDGTLLYMDLDIVINANIDKLFTYNPDKFCIIRDFNRSLRSDWNRMNSSIFRLKSGSMGYVFDNFMESADMNMRRFHGDQDWIFAEVGPNKKDWMFWIN